jgi:indolepyruvate ferredoxin oxidoreductase beta subunit
MMVDPLRCDPYNLIITGVGGQGNVLASRVVGDMLMRQGFQVTIGETFGASQRGGSVMSHIRISGGGVLSPQIPRGTAHMVVALEPTEAIRVLGAFGNPSVKVVCSTRPIQSAGVICGDQTYPAVEQIVQWINELSARAWFIDTTDEALKLGNPIFGNIMAVGALAATGELPMAVEVFENVISQKLPAATLAVNLRAYEVGERLVSAD